MKPLIFFAILFFALISACGKVEKLEPDISFRKYNPNLRLNPVDSLSYMYNSNCFEYLPFPTDSTQSIRIDVDKDEIDDFEFTYTTFYAYQNSVDSCENYNSSISIKAIGASNKVIVEDEFKQQVLIFEQGDDIEKTNTVSDSAIIFLDDYSAEEQYPLSAGNKLIGVRLTGNKMAWIKVAYHKEELAFSIIEHAYNDNFHLGITAGSLE